MLKEIDSLGNYNFVQKIAANIAANFYTTLSQNLSKIETINLFKTNVVIFI